MLIYFLLDFILCQTGLRCIIYKDCYNWDCELVSQLPMPKEKKHCKTNNSTVFSAFLVFPNCGLFLSAPVSSLPPAALHPQISYKYLPAAFVNSAIDSFLYSSFFMLFSSSHTCTINQYFHRNPSSFTLSSKLPSHMLALTNHNFLKNRVQTKL